MAVSWNILELGCEINFKNLAFGSSLPFNWIGLNS